jgi:hypothetical protein
MASWRSVPTITAAAAPDAVTRDTPSATRMESLHFTMLLLG